MANNCWNWKDYFLSNGIFGIKGKEMSGHKLNLSGNPKYE